jgi:hypothetical protein
VWWWVGVCGVQKSSVEGLFAKEIKAKELPQQAFLKLGHATCLDSKLHPILNVKHAIQGQVAIHKIRHNELRFLPRFIPK